MYSVHCMPYPVWFLSRHMSIVDMHVALDNVQAEQFIVYA